MQKLQELKRGEYPTNNALRSPRCAAILGLSSHCPVMSTATVLLLLPMRLYVGASRVRHLCLDVYWVLDFEERIDDGGLFGPWDVGAVITQVISMSGRLIFALGYIRDCIVEISERQEIILCTLWLDSKRHRVTKSAVAGRQFSEYSLTDI